MTEETAITIPDDVRAAFMAFDDDYLADVLRLRDCDLRVWHDPVAVVFRFEGDDILLWCEMNTLRCQKGAVDTTTSRSSIPEKVDASIDADACICWLPDDSYSDFIGLTGIAHDLLRAMSRFSL